jgi:inosine-uridine nucleoside N-ribohydrolase
VLAQRSTSGEDGQVNGLKSSRIFLVAVLAVLMGGIACVRAQESVTTPQLVIIDTDIGDDIDDAYAVALALKSPELKILGVTTTFGDTALRARLLDRYLKAVGRSDIPVNAGPSLLADTRKSHAWQKRKTPPGMTQAEYALHSPARRFGDGAEFILREAREHPGEITLIGIGPLFTVQAAIERDPAAFRKLRRVVIMGGSIERGYGVNAQGNPNPPQPEWNILCNPAGAKALLASGVPVFMMPLDSTQVPLDEKNRETLSAYRSPLNEQLTLLYREWVLGTPTHSLTPTLFDPVAVTYTFRPDLCPVKPMHIDVSDEGLTLPGTGAPNAQVCLQSDEKGFLDLLLSRLTGQ